MRNFFCIWMKNCSNAPLKFIHRLLPNSPRILLLLMLMNTLWLWEIEFLSHSIPYLISVMEKKTYCIYLNFKRKRRWLEGLFVYFLFFKLWRDVAGFVKPLSLWIVVLQYLWVCTILGQSPCAEVQPYSSARCGRSSVSFDNWFFNQLQVRVLGILFASI